MTKRLLVVDDEKDFAEMVARVGGQLGYATRIATTGGEFTRLYLAETPDIVVLDIVMPDVDGIELMRWLVEQGSRARIVMTSGYNPVFANAATVIAEAGGLIPITYLQKPVKIADLRAALSAGP